MVRMVRHAPEADFDHVLDEVSDDEEEEDDAAEDINMEDGDVAQRRVSPQPARIPRRGGREQDMEDAPQLEGYTL